MRRTRSWYEKHTDSQLRGRRVRTVRELSNAYMTIPVGAFGTIERKFSGVAIEFDTCESCGAQARMTKVSPVLVELVPLPEKAK